VERFLQLFARFVDFAYAIWDRIVLRGYYEALQRPENIVYFFREICGVRCITPKVLARRTEQYCRWVEGYAQRRDIPILSAPKGVRKEDFVARHYERFHRDEGVVVILKSMEQASSFVSYEPRFRPPSGDDYRLIKRAAAKRFLHYYFYIMDPVMGPMSLRVGTYLPFTLGCFMNGHSYLAQRLRLAGVRFRKEDNAIVSCADREELGRLVLALDDRLLRERADYWAWRLAPSFTPRERRMCKLHYQWSVAQIEFAHDVIFRRRAPLRSLFRRATEIGVALGGATQTRQIFGRRIDRRYRGKLETVLERRDEGHPVLRAYYQTSYVKQYEKGDRLLRTETCLNDTYHLHVGRKLENLPALKEQLAATTERYLAQQAELLDSTVDTGAFAKLAQPIEIGRRRVPGIKLHDDRVIRLLDTLLYTGGLLGDWTTRDLHARLLARHRLTETDYTIDQLRYDLRKLRAHGLVERIGKSRRYRLTSEGIRLGVLLVKARDRLLGPIISLRVGPKAKRSVNPSHVEAALRNVDKALDTLCDELGLRRAA
jgi:DNA-binding transcriptional ArsR family regulator